MPADDRIEQFVTSRSASSDAFIAQPAMPRNSTPEIATRRNASGVPYTARPVWPPLTKPSLKRSVPSFLTSIAEPRLPVTVCPFRSIDTFARSTTMAPVAPTAATSRVRT